MALQAVGDSCFPNLPELVEQIVSYLDTKALINVRGLNKIWYLEAMSALERRGDITVSWIKGEETRTLMSGTTNPELFKKCLFANSLRFHLAASRSLLQDFGRILTIVTLDLGTDFIFRDYSGKKEVADDLFNLVTLWGVNMECLEVKLPLKKVLATITELGHYNANEVYISKFSVHKKSNLKKLKLSGRMAPLFPNLVVDIIKSSPKLEELHITELPPDIWLVTSLKQKFDMGPKNIAFLTALAHLPNVTKKLKKFSWTLTNEYFLGIQFEPMTEAAGCAIILKLSQMQFGQLEVLELDASMIGRTQTTTDHLNIFLLQNQPLRELTFTPCSEYTGRTLTHGNVSLPIAVAILASLPNLKRLTIDSQKGIVINLFMSVVNFPKLEILEVRRKDLNPFEYHLATAYGCLFRASQTIEGSPLLSLKKLEFHYPMMKDHDLHAVFDSFPNLEEFIAPMGFGSKFRFRNPNNTICKGTFHFPRKLHRMVLQFHKKMRKLKVFHVICNVEIHYMKYWNKAFETIVKLKGLGELVIDCRASDAYLPNYSNRVAMYIRDTFRFQKKHPFPIRIIPKDGQDRIFPAQC